MANKILSNGIMVKYEAGEGIDISGEYINKKTISAVQSIIRSVFYVSREGNDSNHGLSPSSPLLTISEACRRVNEIEQISSEPISSYRGKIIVAPGVYEEGVKVSSGTFIDASQATLKGGIALLNSSQCSSLGFRIDIDTYIPGSSEIIMDDTLLNVTGVCFCASGDITLNINAINIENTIELNSGSLFNNKEIIIGQEALEEGSLSIKINSIKSVGSIGNIFDCCLYDSFSADIKEIDLNSLNHLVWDSQNNSGKPASLRIGNLKINELQDQLFIVSSSDFNIKVDNIFIATSKNKLVDLNTDKKLTFNLELGSLKINKLEQDAFSVTESNKFIVNISDLCLSAVQGSVFTAHDSSGIYANIINISNAELNSNAESNYFAKANELATINLFVMDSQPITISGNVNVMRCTLPVATTETLGGVKQGDNITISADGTISATGTTYTAGENIKIENGWTISENIPEGLDVKGIAHGNEWYIAVGNYSSLTENQKPGAILISKNGETWQAFEPPSERPLMGIAYGEDQYVLTSDKEVFTCSEVNIEKGNWTKKIEAENGTYYFGNVLFGNGNFVTLGLYNPGGEGISYAMGTSVRTSVDGENWESYPINYDLIDPIFRYSCGKFFIGGISSPYPFNPIVLCSSDGKNYEEIYRKELDSGASLSEVAYNGISYLVVDTGACYMRTEETDWQSYGVSNYKSIISLGNEFVGYKGKNEIYKSNNGRNWRKQESIPNGAFENIVQVDNNFALFGPSLIALRGNSRQGIISAIDTTYTAGENITIDADGKISTKDMAYTLPVATTEILGGVKQGDNVTIASDGTISATDTVYTLPIATTETLGGVKTGDNITIDADGEISATGTTYTAGENIKIEYGWTKEAKEISSNDLWGATCGKNTVGQSLFIVVGRGGIILVNKDGGQWEQKGDLNQSNLLNEVAYGNGKFVVVGGYKNPKNQRIEKGIMSISTDGETWSPQTLNILSDTTNLYEIKYVNNQFIAVGSKGMIMMSQDGDTWNKKPTGIQGAETFDLHGIAYGETLNGSFLYVIPAYEGVVLTSKNGENWTKQSISDISRFYDAEYGIVNGEGLFVLVGTNAAVNNGVILTSKTGAQGSWKRIELTDIAIQAVSYKNGEFIALGTKGTIFTSYDGQNWVPQVLPEDYTLWGFAYNNSKILVSGSAGSIFTAPISPVISSENTTYTAGSNISINNGIISAIDTKYTAGDNISIDENNKISATDTTYTLPTATVETLGGVKQGQNIVITSDGTISAVGGIINIYKTQITLSSNGWQYHGNDIYLQRIPLEHFVIEDSTVIIDIILDEAPSGDYTIISQQLREWAKVKGRKLYNGGIDLYSYCSAPDINLDINIQVIA